MVDNSNNSNNSCIIQIINDFLPTITVGHNLQIIIGNLSATGLSQLNYDKVIVTGTTVHLSRYSRTEPLIMDSMVGIWAQLRVNMLRLRH